MPRAPFRRLSAALLAALMLLAPACSGDDDDDSAKPDGGSKPINTAKTGFQADVDEALKVFTQALTEGLPAIQNFREGKSDKATVTLAIDRLSTEANRAVMSLDGVKAGNGEERTAKVLYTASAYLYREMAAVAREGINSGDAALSKQLDLAAMRLRILADRVYDRGRLTLDPRFFDTSADIQINRPPDVPDWPAEGHAPGPPLDDEPPDHSGTYPERSVFRHKGPESEWVKAVQAADVPTAQELAGAIHATDATALRDAARRLQAAAKALDEAPDPDDDTGRERAATVRLGLLVSAEAARMAQAALIGPAEQKAALAQEADQLLFIGGDLLWDDALPHRRSGLDDTIMDEPLPPEPATTTTAPGAAATTTTVKSAG